jgi:hypothetical protein
MNNVSLFLCGLGTTVLASLLVVFYLHSHLRGILIDLCGTVERAEFWAAFTNLAFLLVPLIFALNYNPEFGPRSAVLQVAAQFKAALIGLVVTVLVVGFVLARFISRSPLPLSLKNETRAVK